MRTAVRVSGRMPVFLGLLAFWAGMVVAAAEYPGGYDWQYTTISSLVYAERNASGFLAARAGMVLCGLLGLYWTARFLPRGTARNAPPRAAVAALQFGYTCLFACAVLPEHLLRIPRAHDALALAAFLGLCCGTTLMTFAAVRRAAQPRPRPPASRLHAGILAGLALSPVLLAVLAQTYVSHVLPALPWVSPVWRARGVPAYLSFAFWEWITCAVVSLYLVILSRSVAPPRRYG